MGRTAAEWGSAEANPDSVGEGARIPLGRTFSTFASDRTVTVTGHGGSWSVAAGSAGQAPCQRTWASSNEAAGHPGNGIERFDGTSYPQSVGVTWSWVV